MRAYHKKRRITKPSPIMFGHEFSPKELHFHTGFHSNSGFQQPITTIEFFDHTANGSELSLPLGATFQRSEQYQRLNCLTSRPYFVSFSTFFKNGIPRSRNSSTARVTVCSAPPRNTAGRPELNSIPSDSTSHQGSNRGSQSDTNRNR